MNDGTGLHYSSEGIAAVMLSFEETLNPPDESRQILDELRVNRKRNLSQLTVTPPSVERRNAKRRELNAEESQESFNY